uniref:Uncharacterized protein n=1 Tax=viral metagenome TaxID=1070528 RepID=A0A6C0B0T1_9ZZZZ
MENKNLVFLICLFVLIYVLYVINKKVALIVFIFGFTIFIIKQLPIELDKWLHTKLINLPEYLKCALDINCGHTGCGEHLNDTFEAQKNADVDFYTVGHVIFWVLLAKVEPRLTLIHVLLISLLWELIEIYAGCQGFKMHGRLTDIFFNVLGFCIGKSI